MIGNSLLTQIAIVGVAIGIIVTYIQPKIQDIGRIQDKIAQTQEELEKVNAVNNKLKALMAQVAAIAPKDKQSLSVYMPEVIDEVKVMKDLEAIATKADVIVNSLTYAGETTLPAPTEVVDPTVVIEQPMAHDFTMVTKSSYEQAKLLLLLLERNNYPLDVQNLAMKPADGGLLDVSLDLRTYSFK